MGWVYLFIAIILETGATWCMRSSEGFERWGFTLPMLMLYGLSFVFLNLTLKYLPLSVSYAFWAGLGTFLVAGVGVFFFGDSLDWIKGISVLLIVVGLVGLKLGASS